MNFKANDSNTTNATDATITVLGVGNTSGDNTGTICWRCKCNTIYEWRKFFSFKNTANNLLTMNFNANDTNTYNTIDSSITCTGIAGTTGNSGTLGLVTNTTNISQALTQIISGGALQPYSYIQCINNFSNKVFMLFKANNNNNLNLCDGSIIVAPITGNDLAVNNNNGIIEIQADVIKIGTQKLTTVGTGSSLIRIGDENSDVQILGKLTLTNSVDGRPSCFNQVRNRLP